MITSLKQKEIKFKPRIKLNHNIYCKIAKDDHESRSSVIVLRSEVFSLFIELKLHSAAHAEIGKVRSVVTAT